MSRTARPRAASSGGRVLPGDLPAAAVGAVAVGVTCAAAALAAAFAGAVEPSVINDPGPLVRWGLVVARGLTEVAAALTVGTLVLAAVVLPVTAGRRGPQADRSALTLVAAAATVWAAGSLALLVLTFADALGTPLSDPGVAEQLVQYARTVPAGQGLIYTVVVAALVGLAAAGVGSLRATGLLSLVAVTALVPAALSGHAAGTGDHDTAVTAIGLHLLGVSVWFGGLLALLLLRPVPVVAVTRYSTLAGWSFAAVAASGVLSAWLQLPGLNGFGTSYGLLLVAKSVLLVALGLAGWLHRRSTLRRLESGMPWAFARLALAEAAVMAAAVGLGVALSQSPPPPQVGPSAPVTVTGYPLPVEPTPLRLALGWQPDLLWLVLAGLAAVGYLVAVRRLAGRGDRWPLLRTVPFLLGLLLLAYVTSGGPAVYGRVLFSMHMVGHMTVTMLVAPLLVLGAPATLALRVLAARDDGTRGPREWLLAVLHSPVLRVLAFAPVAAVLFAGSLVVFYYTDLFGLALRTHVGHELMTVHFLITGYLFAWVLIGIDPGPARPGFPLRLVLLFVTMAFHAFFGVALLQSTTVLQESFFAGLNRPWGPSLLADQRDGGSLAWALGEVPTVLMALVLVLQWARSDDREARRLDRAAERDGDADLAAYNARLAALADRARPQ